MRLALQTIYRKGPTSRAEIARETELAKATVSDLVGRLLDDGLVVELGTGISAGGKPPTLVSLAPKSRSIVALDLSTVPFTGAIADLQGSDRAPGREVLASRRATTHWRRWVDWPSGSSRRHRRR